MAGVFQRTWILPILLVYAGWSFAAKLETVYEWKYIDYAWVNETQKQDLINSGEYDHTKIIPIDFKKISGNRILVTTPRYEKNPATLSVVSNKSGDGGPLLDPYPNWDWHKIGNCSGITSVNTIFLDECNRLWTVDTGRINNERLCPPKILAFDPETDEVLVRVEIPKNLTHNSINVTRGKLEVQFVETRGDSCNQTWVYISDPEGYGLVIWDGEDTWRLENDKVFAPDPTATTFSVAGENFTLNVGISHMQITPPGFLDTGYLVFKPLASVEAYAAPLEDLHNSKTGSKVTYYKSNFTPTSQVLSAVFSKSGISIGGFATELVVACWNLQHPLVPSYLAVLLQDEVALQFTSATEIIEGPGSNFEDEEYWVLTNRLQKFFLNTIDFNDTNFRILRANLATLVTGTVCEPMPHTVVSTLEEKLFIKLED